MRRSRHNPWTREEAIAAIRAYRHEHGVAPTAVDFNRGSAEKGLPSSGTMHRLFGERGWHALAMAAADVQPRRRGLRRWSKESIVEAFRAFGHKHGRPPTRRDADERTGGLPCNDVVRTHFASWNAAIEAAGFQPRAGGRRQAIPRVFDIGAVAAELGLSLDEWNAVADQLARSTRCSSWEADDALQDAWISFAWHTANHEFPGDPCGWLFVAARRRLIGGAYRVTRPRDASLQAFETATGRAAGSYDQQSHIEARLRLAELVERCKPGDDVLHVVASMEREALNLYEPIAQRGEAAILDGLPSGRWLDKLRAAYAAGEITCVCWEHVREFGITPPPEVAQHFPDCMGQRHGTLTPRVEKTRPPVMASILAALGVGDTAAVAA